MGWSEKLASGKYRAVYRDSQGRKRSAGTFVRKPDAVRKANSAEEDERNEPTPIEAKTLTWGDWEPRWQAGRTVEASTRKTDEPKLKVHVRPRWEGEALRDITAEDVQQWVSDLSALGLAPSTVAKCYHLLSNSLKAAVKARILKASPCQQIALPPPTLTPERFLELEEYDAIRQSADDFDQILLDVLVGTGMRLGEALALHWESVDFKRKVVTVEWSYDRETKRFKAPKDNQARTVPLSDKLTTQLEDLLEERGAGDPAPLPYQGNRKVRTGLVFAHIEGKPLNGDNFRHRFEASARIAWVGKGKSRRRVGHVRLHDLRHTYASRLVRAGVPIQEVSRLLGHAKITTTMRYAHLAQSQWDSVRAALN